MLLRKSTPYCGLKGMDPARQGRCVQPGALVKRTKSKRRFCVKGRSEPKGILIVSSVPSHVSCPPRAVPVSNLTVGSHPTKLGKVPGRPGVPGFALGDVLGRRALLWLYPLWVMRLHTQAVLLRKSRRLTVG